MSNEVSGLQDLLDLAEFGAVDNPPPPVLYKYMISDRIDDVLERGMVRFTHLVNTNDSFEIRKTFKSFTGPKFEKLMMKAAEIAVTNQFIEDHLKKLIAEHKLPMTTKEVRALLETQTGMRIEDMLREQMKPFLDLFMQSFHKVKTPEDFLEELGSTLLCFSLSERFDLPTMWAHYGGGHTGIVVVFDTNDEWFKRADKPDESRLQKVLYVDEQLDEVFDNLQAAVSSKTTDWSYEREWRLNCGMQHIDQTVPGTDIHLRSFPPTAVSAVIVGSKASNETVEKVREILKRKYPHARLQKTTPQRMSGTFDLQEI